jgi:hypothetical protein
MNMLTKKRKAASVTTPTDQPAIKQKKIKTTHSTLSNGDSKETKEPIIDCRQMPFKGIAVKT